MAEREFEFKKLTADQLGSVIESCTKSGGTSKAIPQPDGTFTVVCTVPASAPAKPAVAVASSQLSATFVAGTAISPDKREVGLDLLHPQFRARIEAIQADLVTQGVPMKLFEAYRAPERQAMLFAKGRKNGVIVDKSKVVTYADAWESYHQYGLAVDMVIDAPGFTPWQTGGAADGFWKEYHRIAKSYGAERLKFEEPHIQEPGATAKRLLSGDYPPGGDAAWAGNLNTAIARWQGTPKPPAVSGFDRPALVQSLSAAPAIQWANLPPVAVAAPQSVNGGQVWRVDGGGIYLQGSNTPLRSPGNPKTCAKIVELYGAEIAAASVKHSVAPELIIMTIATEAGIFIDDDFTGPSTFRWEAGVTVGETGNPAIDGIETGDYSAGPTQVLGTTARWMNRVLGLGYAAKVLPHIANKPSPAPALGKLGLYDAAVAIDIGAGYIRHQSPHTAMNPILVAAAYNAGSVIPSGATLWGLKVTGNHLDRAAQWFGDACAVLGVLGR